MTKIPTYEDIENRIKNYNISKYQVTICKNIKKFRKELYEENKQYYKDNNLKNPYSSQAVSELLGISHEYYKRLESYDKTKPISIKLFFKIVELFNKDVSEFLKE